MRITALQILLFLPEVICLFLFIKNSSHVWFLVGNDVYRMGANREKEKILLDPLPDGFIYTGICCENSRIYLFWEYQSFFKTGKSGFLIIDEKRVDKKYNLRY